MTNPTELLAARVREAPAQPLLTQYAAAGRTELSAASFANWVDKTTNWLEDEGIADLYDPPSPAPLLALELAADQPAHWMTFAWLMAAWQAGLAVSPGPAEGAVLRVGGPGAGAGGPVTVACSLHPLAMPGDPAPGVLDWAAEVRAQPDVHLAVADDPSRAAWAGAPGARSLGELLDGVAPAPGPVLISEPAGPWPAVRDGLLAPLLGGGSAVLAPRVPAAELDRIRAAERIA
ncbi:uncharacterized protein (TIGR03089 family) [Naumannella cuiyingiana]|uniref:Uncharacterized protein (TIGR03089 family) n=1 Tax=Naumannella cuiyingiana TaxID=1347891 RepID=A0A7Z0IK62_9ACTN|nr:uncharacterized protein (TIGR03089 family) [Naumannella cuiyingiana]